MTEQDSPRAIVVDLSDRAPSPLKQDRLALTRKRSILFKGIFFGLGTLLAVGSGYIAFHPSRETSHKVRIVLDIQKEPSPQRKDSPSSPSPTPSPVRVSIVVAELGMDPTLVQQALSILPTSISLAFVPYTADLQGWLQKAQTKGYNTLLMIPMQPDRYPANDAGPMMLKVGVAPEDNMKKLTELLKTYQLVQGVMDYMGSRFMKHAEAIEPLFQELKQRNLPFIDSRSALMSLGQSVCEKTKTPYLSVTHLLDTAETPEALRKNLDKLVDQAHIFSYAIGLIYPSSQAFQILKEWASRLPHVHVDLIPVTQLLSTEQKYH